MSAPRPLMPLEVTVVAILVERLGGKVVISDAELAAFDRRAKLVQHGTMDGFVVEVHRPPITVPGEVLESGPVALPAGGVA